MKQAERRIEELSARLQRDLLAFSGKRPGPTPGFRPQLLIPLAVIAAAAVLLCLVPKARKSMLVELTLMASTDLLRRVAGA